MANSFGFVEDSEVTVAKEDFGSTVETQASLTLMSDTSSSVPQADGGTPTLSPGLKCGPVSFGDTDAKDKDTDPTSEQAVHDERKDSLVSDHTTESNQLRSAQMHGVVDSSRGFTDKPPDTDYDQFVSSINTDPAMVLMSDSSFPVSRNKTPGADDDISTPTIHHESDVVLMSDSSFPVLSNKTPGADDDISTPTINPEFDMVLMSDSNNPERNEHSSSTNDDKLRSSTNLDPDMVLMSDSNFPGLNEKNSSADDDKIGSSTNLDPDMVLMSISSSPGLNENSSADDERLMSSTNHNLEMACDWESSLGLNKKKQGTDDDNLKPTIHPDPDLMLTSDSNSSRLNENSNADEDKLALSTNPDPEMVCIGESSSGLTDKTSGNMDANPDPEMVCVGESSPGLTDKTSGNIDPNPDTVVDITAIIDCHPIRTAEPVVSDEGTPQSLTDTSEDLGAGQQCFNISQIDAITEDATFSLNRDRQQWENFTGIGGRLAAQPYTDNSLKPAVVFDVSNCNSPVVAKTVQQNLHKHHHVHNHTQPTEFRSLKESTKERLSLFDVRGHVVTRATKDAVRILQRSNKVMIVGEPKQGATTLVDYLARTWSVGKYSSFTPVELSSPDQWLHLPPSGKYVFILENFLSWSDSLDHQWSNFLEKAQTKVDKGDVVLIMSCQKNKYDQYRAKNRGHYVTDQRYLVDLSTYKLRKFEQVLVLEKIFSKLKVNVTTKELFQIAEKTFQERFFEGCEYFWRNRSLQNLDKKFFANPMQMVREEISQSLCDNKPLFFALVQVALKTIDVVDVRTKYPSLSQEMDCYGEYGTHIDGYCIETNGNLGFKHNCILLCTFLALLDFDDHIFIRMCPLDILVNFTTVKGPEEKPSEKIKLHQNLLQELSHRLQEGLVMNQELALRHDFFSEDRFFAVDEQMVSVLMSLDPSCLMKNATRLGHIGLLELSFMFRDLFTMPHDFKHELLHQAISSLNIDIFELLLRNGAEVCEECFLHVDLLDRNISSNGLEMMLELIGTKDMGVFVIETSLGELFRHGHSIIASKMITLLESRSDFPDLLTSLIDLSCRFGQKELYLRLLSYQKQFQPSSQLLLHGIEGGCVKIVEDLMNRKGNPNIRFPSKLSALQFAAEQDNLNLFRYLLGHGGNINEQTGQGQSVLHLAASVAKKKQPAILPWILSTAGLLPVDILDKERQTPLHLAATTGNKAVVMELIKAGAHISSHDAKGNTPLHCLVMSANPDLDIIEYFIEKGADIDARNGDGETPLQQLVQTGKENDRCNILQCLISKTKERDAVDRSGSTLLQSLLIHGCNIEEAEVLIEGGCDIKRKDNKGNTVLHLLASLGNHQLVKVALGKGADANIRDSNGDTPLHVAVRHPDNDQVVGELMKCQRSVDVENNDGNNPLHLACFTSEVNSIKYIQHLTEIQPSLMHARNKERKTALHMAAASEGPCSPANTEHLLFGSDVHATDINGDTPLHAACFLCGPNSVQIIQTLILYEADVNVLNRDGNSLLHAACLGQGPSRENIVNILIGYRSKVLSQNHHGSTPIDLVRFTHSEKSVALTDTLTNAVISEVCHSKEGYYPRIVKLLEKCQFVDNDETILHKVCTTSGKNTRRIISELVSAGHKVNKTDLKGRTPLHVACRMPGKYSVEIVKELLVHGASVNDKDGDGYNALHVACSTNTKESPEIVKVLVENKASVDARSNDGDTALHIACGPSGAVELIRLLINFGADMDLRDSQGLAPIDMMSRVQVNTDVKSTIYSAQLWKICNRGERLHEGGIKSLLDRGASLNYKSRDGDTCLHLLCQQKAEHTYENVKLLLSLGANPHARNNFDYNPYETALFSGNMKIAKIVYERQQATEDDENEDDEETSGISASSVFEEAAGICTTYGDILDKVEGACKDDHKEVMPMVDVLKTSATVTKTILTSTVDVIQKFKDFAK